MKVQVTEKAKGELFVRAIGKTMRSGSIITLSDDQFYDSATQAAIQAEFLTVLDGPEKKEAKGEEYINVYKNSLSFKCIRRTIPSGATFFVCEELLDESEIVSAFNSGYIQFANTAEPDDSDDAEDLVEETSVIAKNSIKTEDKSELNIDKTTKTSKKASSKKSTVKKADSKSKKIKRVGSKDEVSDTEVKVSVGKPPKETEMDGGEPTDTHALPEKSQVETPKGMYSHDPTGEGMTVRRAKAPHEISDELNFVDSSSKNNEISFVDQEQTRERAKKNGITTDDIFKSNIEVE